MTALNSTTLAAAVAASDKTIQVASATNVAVGHVLVVDREAMLVLAISGTFVHVFRGERGFAQAHASGAVVWTNPKGAYFEYDPAGAGVAANELYLPHINLQNFNAWTIVNGQWVKFLDAGLPVALPGGAASHYTEAGALTLVPGIHSIDGAAAIAMTLAEPGPQTPEGAIMVIQSGTAQAHTVTYTAGFAANTTSGDVATFGAAIGNSMTIQNIGGAWRILALNGVTVA